MFDGSTSGRGFEHEWSLYIWGAILIVSIVAWLLFQRDLKRHALKRHKDEQDLK